MKSKFPLLIIFLSICSISIAQSHQSALKQNSLFSGAVATQKMYHAIYQLDSNDPKTIGKTIRNINNVLNDPRLKGKLKIELITFSGGTEACMKGSKYEDALKALVEKGVIVAQCHNSLLERKINRDSLYDFVAIVPSGNGELIIRGAEGWTIIKP